MYDVLCGGKKQQKNPTHVKGGYLIISDSVLHSGSLNVTFTSVTFINLCHDLCIKVFLSVY